MKPLISVIVPIYNAEKYLDECIRSIQEQTYENLQIVLINDGSTDNSLSICKYYEGNDHRILVLDQPNAGVSTARNLGLSVADGEYIGFVDSDDSIEKNMYESMLRIIIEDNSELCTMINYTINKTKSNYKGIGRCIDKQEAIKSILLLQFPTSLWAYLYSKESIKDISLNSQVHFFEDFLFNLEILQKSNRISVCEDNYYNYRISDTSINSQTINDKRMTCLKINDLLDDCFFKNNILYKKYSAFFKAHSIISIILSISKSKESPQKYYNEAKRYSKTFFENDILSEYVPILYKIVITIFYANPKIFSKVLYWLKYR